MKQTVIVIQSKKSFLLLFNLILYLVFGFEENVSAQEIPNGRVESFAFQSSKIFPGTVRKVFVYVPNALNRNKPACVYVQQDGLDKKKIFTKILDTLIAKKEIPMLVGVFITPGKLSPPEKNTLSRPNRCLEYDGLGDSYVRFLLEEILPDVEKRYNLKLSNSGNDRAIGGASSGGIAAFNAAWERPDAFSRIYCNSGSFVAFRGGHEFPALIRKTDPKPIRTFLTVGTNDMENCAGDWTLINFQMEKALKFSGYDYQFHVLEGKHVVGYGDYFADAMRFLWKGWPEVVKAGSGAPRVRDIIIPDESWQLISTGFGDVQGATCNSKGEVFFTDPPNNMIYKIDLNEQVSKFVENAGHCNSLSVGSNDELYSISATSGFIMSYDTAGQKTLFAEDIYGKYIFARPNGGFYISSTTSDHEPDKIWLVEKGKTPIVIDEGLKYATGIAMSPDQWLLAVADGASHWVYSYEISKDGKLLNKEKYFWLHVNDRDDDSGAGPLCYDKEGHLYVGTRYGIQVCTWDGPTQVILPLPDGTVTGLCFGGKNLDTLFALCGDKIYKRRVKTHGFGSFSPWMKMTRGKL